MSDKATLASSTLAATCLWETSLCAGQESTPHFKACAELRQASLKGAEMGTTVLWSARGQRGCTAHPRERGAEKSEANEVSGLSASMSAAASVTRPGVSWR